MPAGGGGGDGGTHTGHGGRLPGAGRAALPGPGARYCPPPPGVGGREGGRVSRPAEGGRAPGASRPWVVLGSKAPGPGVGSAACEAVRVSERGLVSPGLLFLREKNGMSRLEVQLLINIMSFPKFYCRGFFVLFCFGEAGCVPCKTPGSLF